MNQKWGGGGELTLVPFWDELKTVDHLRIETRRDLDAHTGGVKQQVEDSQIPLLIPRDLVLCDDSRQDGVTFVTEINETHDEEVMLVWRGGRIR